MCQPRFWGLNRHKTEKPRRNIMLKYVPGKKEKKKSKYSAKKCFQGQKQAIHNKIEKI